MSKADRIEGTFIIEGELFILKQERQVITAKVLGNETGEAGAHTIWLDRRIHDRNQQRCMGYRLSGVITTILTK